MALISDDLKSAKTFLEAGELVAIPTETVYGLAANALDGKSVRKIFEAKNRPSYNPLIVHIGAREQLGEIVRYIPEKAQQLIDEFWPGPLTIVLPKQSKIPKEVTGEHSTVGVRMPNHPLTLKLLQMLRFPLAAPSANKFGKISPTTSAHVQQGLGDVIPMILEGGPCSRGIESTIVGFDKSNEVVILRHGVISQCKIESIVGPVISSTNNDTSPQAPGMLTSHYSPNKPSLMVENIGETLTGLKDKKVGVLSYSKAYKLENVISNLVLSPSENAAEAARNLYAYLHQLDNSPADILILEKLPKSEISESINDKLRRATA